MQFNFKECSILLKNAFFRDLRSRKPRGEGHFPGTFKCPGASLSSDGGFNYTQSDFVVSRQVLFIQTQISCNLILLASLCCNLRLDLRRYE